MRFRLFWFAFLLLLLPISARATTVTGTVVDSQGYALGGAAVQLQLQNCGTGNVCTVTSSGAVVLTLVVSTRAAANGSFSVSVTGNDAITPSGTFYAVRYLRQSNLVYTANYSITGSTYNLGQHTPLGAFPPAPFVSVGYRTVEASGIVLSAEEILNLIGTGVSCADNPLHSRTDCTFLGGGGGGSISLETNSSPNTAQDGLNFVTSSTNAVGLVITPLNPSDGIERFEVSGTYTGTASALAGTPTLCQTGYAPTGIAASGNATGCAPLVGYTPSGIQYGIAYYLTTSTLGSTTPSSTRGQFFFGRWNTTSASSAPQEFQIGFAVRNVIGDADTVGYNDCSGVQVQFLGANAATESLPDATTLNNPKCGFAILNATTGSSTAVTVTTSTWHVNGVSTPPQLTVAQNEYCWIYVDPAGGAWDAMCHATTHRP
jgi:hypothetical protein